MRNKAKLITIRLCYIFSWWQTQNFQVQPIAVKVEGWIQYQGLLYQGQEDLDARKNLDLIVKVLILD